MKQISHFMVAVLGIALSDCAATNSVGLTKFDDDGYRNRCMKSVVAELFTSDTTTALDRMPQDQKYYLNGFPISVAHPHIYAIITNYRNSPIHLKVAKLRDSLIVVDRLGYIRSKELVFWDRDDAEITIPSMGSYTYCMAYPALSENGGYSVRLENIYSEPLRITYRK